ncbi:tRNA (guanosine(46)-N(7))-methyltransferase TrmB [Stappia sp. MMSF_3263]|uniref:tRNA (guanine(46)-N(7))-methyltransferase TrmB n=1 Tax=Stappia sp. MMSF_3263 TaxID=3046693 RepID=UPI00273D5037|nr:tRNA (guanine(46)-N(7))-methyltransferase TrmB [Stappia sp. MMSF_3263]
MIDHSKGSFFGRRVGKPLRAARREIFEAAIGRLQPDLGRPAPADLRDMFASPVDEVWMEIGFGGGEHLLHEAGRLPRTGFIGVEPFVSSLAKTVADIEAAEFGNVRVYGDDAIKLLDWLPEASLDGIYQLYPDPWPKRRHWKRRFVNPVNLDRIARVLRPGTCFRFASDIDTYVEWTLAHLAAHPAFEWTAERAADWLVPWQPWSGTRYEDKAFREGRKGHYLEFRRC